jgi:hypothetical protein
MDCKKDPQDFKISGEEYDFHQNKRFGNVVLLHFQSKRTKKGNGNELKSKIVFLNEFTKILKIFDFDETENIIDDIVFSGDRVYASTINKV